MQSSTQYYFKNLQNFHDFPGSLHALANKKNSTALANKLKLIKQQCRLNTLISTSQANQHHLPSVVTNWKCIVSGIWYIFSQQIQSLLCVGFSQNAFRFLSRYPTIEIADGTRPRGILCHLHCLLKIPTEVVWRPTMFITRSKITQLPAVKCKNNSSVTKLYIYTRKKQVKYPKIHLPKL